MMKSTLESRIIVPLRLIFRFFSTQDMFIPALPIINFQSFLLTFLSVNSHFHKEKEIVQSSAITMNYVNTKQMLSL